MTSVTIGLKDKQLLKWFNEMHAALKKAEQGYNTAATDTANQNLIATLQAVIREIRGVSVLQTVGSLFKKK